MFETKKYIRNVGKYCNLGGKFYHVPGKSYIFSSHANVINNCIPHFATTFLTFSCLQIFFKN